MTRESPFSFDEEALPCVEFSDGSLIARCGVLAVFAANEEMLAYAQDVDDGSEQSEEVALQRMEHITARFLDAGFCPYRRQRQVDETEIVIRRPSPSGYDYGQCTPLQQYESARLN